MSWTTVSTELKDNQTQIQIKGSDVNRLLVQGDHTCINWSQLGTNTI